MTKRKNLALVICLVLVTALVSVGGTLAWLKDATTPVTNTFTVGDVGITLKETTGDEYQMIPGSVLDKDPTVTVEANSENVMCLLK